MSEQQSSYRQIMKATSIFGGVQVFTIIVAIIKSKFIAVLLGPAGMGIAGLLTSTTGLINGLTNFGLGTSAVKDVAAANATGDETRIATIVTVLRRWVWITGLLGALVTLIFSHWLSLLTFGNAHYTVAFVWLAITLLFQQLTTGRLVVLQGMRKLSYLAKANMTGSLMGLFISVPIYYIYGVSGIVPALFLSSITAMLVAWYFSRKVAILPVRVTRAQTVEQGRGMLKLGFMISLTGLITMGIAYLVRIFISHTGGVAQVGLYNAGFTIVNTYVGIVFAAMATDYFPRLSEVAMDNEKTRVTINQQAEILILVLAPIIVSFIVFIRWIIIVLYSHKFVAIDAMIHWAMVGILFKATSWSISFVFMAKGDAKLFFWNEFFSSIYFLLLNIAGYYYFGLTGLGISFVICYLLYLLQVFLITKLRYNFYFHRSFIRLFAIQMLIVSVTFAIVFLLLEKPYSYYAGIIILVLSSVFSFYELNKRLGLKSLFQKKPPKTNP